MQYEVSNHTGQKIYEMRIKKITGGILMGKKNQYIHITNSRFKNYATIP
jgi:hypothetical protein